MHLNCVLFSLAEEIPYKPDYGRSVLSQVTFLHDELCLSLMTHSANVCNKNQNMRAYCVHSS